MTEKRDRTPSIPLGKLTRPFDGRRSPSHLGLAILQLYRLNSTVAKAEQAAHSPASPNVSCGFSQEYARQIRKERDELRKKLEGQVGPLIDNESVVAKAVQVIEQETGFSSSRIMHY